MSSLFALRLPGLGVAEILDERQTLPVSLEELCYVFNHLIHLIHSLAGPLTSW